MNKGTGSELVDVQSDIDHPHERLVKIFRAPTIRRMKQQVTDAVWQKNSVEIMPGEAKQDINLLTTAHGARACQVIVQPKPGAGHKVKPHRRRFHRLGPLRCNIAKLVECRRLFKRGCHLRRGPDLLRL